MYVAILLLVSSLPDVQAHIMLEDPQETGWVSKADALAMECPKVREALKQQCKARKLDKDFDLEMFDEPELGAWVLSLHIARQEVREQRKPKVKIKD